MAMLALWFMLSWPDLQTGWMAIIAAILTVVAGAVGQAQDARRWNRCSPSDDFRMWAAIPGAFGDLYWLRFSSGLGDCVPPHSYFLIGSGAGKSEFGSIPLPFLPSGVALDLLSSCGWRHGVRRRDAVAHISAVASDNARRRPGHGFMLGIGAVM